MNEQEPPEAAAVEPEEATATPTPAPEPETADAPAPEAAPAARPRQLERSRDDRVLAGVCGGVAEYFGVDAVLVRIAALLLIFAGGAGLILYVVGWIAMPESAGTGALGAAGGRAPGEQPAGVPPPGPHSERSPGAVAVGVVFIALGAVFLLDELWEDFLAWKYMWPVVLIVVGAAVLVRARR